MLRTVILALGLLAGGAQAAERLPLFDAHLHYNWEPKPYFTLDEVFKLFKENGVTGILATSRPNDGTRALYEAPQKEVWVVPFIRPYNIRADIQTWFNDPKIYELIEREYQRGYYRGIGEFHLSGSSDAGTPWVKKAVDFAVDKNLYLHAHADDAANSSTRTTPRQKSSGRTPAFPPRRRRSPPISNATPICGANFPTATASPRATAS
ncbi:MAG TPA: hypothetical protein PLW86_07120 [Rhodocyclaceae bacterium]|nr:hypothetical protein [Rhodocyclaceae bacterium]